MNASKPDPRCEYYELWSEVKTRFYIYRKHEPTGEIVSPEQMLLPGIYRAQDGVLYRVKNSPLGRHGFITHTVFVRGGKWQRSYVTFYKGDNINLGISLLLADNEASSVCKVRCNKREVDDETDLNDLEGALEKWANSTLCETWNPRINEYDPGYPTGPSLYDVRPLHGTTDQLPIAGPVDPDLYNNFKVSMKEFIDTPREMTSARMGKTRKVGVCRVMDTIRTIRYRSCAKTSQAFIKAKYDLTRGPVGVTVMPKIGATTSKGKPRLVYPMSPTLQIGLEHCIGKRHVHHHGIRTVLGNNFSSLRYTYDVTQCDYALYPYLRRYVDEELPAFRELFFPPILTPEGPRYREQFFSGLFGTNHIVEAFTAAVIRTAHSCPPGSDCTLEMQGDGVASSHPLEHPLLRPQPEYTINGFCYRNGSGKDSQYVNACLRLNSPRLLNKRKLHGPEGWAFRREIYKRFLNPISLPPNRTEFDFSDLTDRELLKLALKHRICQRKLRYVEADEEYTVNTMVHNSNWDYANTTGEPVPAPELDILELPQLGASSPFDQRHDAMLADGSYTFKELKEMRA